MLARLFSTSLDLTQSDLNSIKITEKIWAKQPFCGCDNELYTNDGHRYDEST